MTEQKIPVLRSKKTSCPILLIHDESAGDPVAPFLVAVMYVSCMPQRSETYAFELKIRKGGRRRRRRRRIVFRGRSCREKRERVTWRDEKCVVITRGDSGMKRPGWCCVSSFKAHGVDVLACVMEEAKMGGKCHSEPCGMMNSKKVSPLDVSRRRFFSEAAQIVTKRFFG